MNSSARFLRELSKKVGKVGRGAALCHRTACGTRRGGLGELLYDKVFKQLIDENVRLYLLAFLADPRGINLRNRVAHGLLEREQMERPLADRVPVRDLMQKNLAVYAMSLAGVPHPDRRRAQSDIAAWTATPGRILSVAARFPL
jgi:hypothetical protein